MRQPELKHIVEAALMVVNEPLSIQGMMVMFADQPIKPARHEIRAVIDELQQEYAGRGVELKEVASGFRFQVCGEVAAWVNRLFEEKPQRYSRALLETLAIIAYRQPITRGEIEDIRGVGVSANIMRTLMEREWVRVVGHRDVPGRPGLLATTRQFLDYFDLRRLSDLPSLTEIKDVDRLNPDLFAALEQEAGQVRNDATGEGMAEADKTSVAELEGAAGQEEEAARDNVIPFSG